MALQTRCLSRGKAAQQQSLRVKPVKVPRACIARAAAKEAPAEASASSSGNMGVRECSAHAVTLQHAGDKWFACVANAKFMLNDVQNESFAEQLREKTRYYKEQGMPMDYFLVCEPAWLDEQHPEVAKKVSRPCVALVAKEESWARYMRLRLDRVVFVEVTGSEEEITKCGAPVPDFERLDGDGQTWTAPYSPYAQGWWDVFMPGKVDA